MSFTSRGSQRNLTLPLNQTSTSALPDVVSPDIDARQLKDQLDTCVAYSRGLQRNFEAVSLKCRKNRDEIKAMRALLDAGEHRIVELLSERDRLSSNADHDRLLREQAIAARDAAQAARDELSSALTKNVQLEDQIESLVTANKRASDDIQRARAVEKKRLDEIARLESMLRNKDDAQSASLLWQRKYDDLTATMEKAHADLDSIRGENTQIRTELQRLTNRLQRAESDRDDYKTDLQKQRKSVALVQTQLGDAEKRSQMYKDTITGLELELTAQRSQAKSFQAANPESNLQRIQQLTVEVQALSEAKAVQASEITVLKDRLKLMGREIEDQLDALVHANKRADQAEARLDSSDTEHSGLMMELESLRGQSAELAQLREQNRALNERIVSLSRQFEDISAQQQNTVAVSEHDALLLQVNELKRANALEESRHAREKSEMIAMHQLELTQRASQIDTLKAELRELQFVKRENVELKNTVESHKEQHAKEKLQLQSEYDRQAALQEKEMAHLNTRVADLLSQIAELNVLIEKPKAQAAELQRMRDRESELRNVVARLIKSEEATEPAFTCLSCSSIYRAPVTCIPCGHSFCLACIETKGHCSQCGPKVKVSYYPNDLLEQLTSKYVSRKQALASLKLMDPAQVKTR